MNTDKKLTRSSTDKQVGGVCGGFAHYFDLDTDDRPRRLHRHDALHRRRRRARLPRDARRHALRQEDGRAGHYGPLAA